MSKADEIVKALRVECNMDCKNCSLVGEEYAHPYYRCDAQKIAADALEQLKTEIDQLKANQPVRCGEWYQEIGDVHSTGKYRNCSICNKSVFIPYFSKQGIERIDFDYCPNCGADMRGEENE